MNFLDLMEEVGAKFYSWLNDPDIIDSYGNDKEAMQKEFIECVQRKIGSDFVVLSKEEHDNILRNEQEII